MYEKSKIYNAKLMNVPNKVRKRVFIVNDSLDN